MLFLHFPYMADTGTLLLYVVLNKSVHVTQTLTWNEHVFIFK